MNQPKAMILFATGTNRDLDVAQALSLAGAQPEVVPLNRLRDGERRWEDFQMLVLAGGFSYADALGAGKLLALDLQAYFSDAVNAFIQTGKPVIGICNGFQALVKAGILPGKAPDEPPTWQASLTFNASGRFECRWVSLTPRSQRCLWTRGLVEVIECPVAHGEGNFVMSSATDVDRLIANDQVALLYRSIGDGPAGYPANPNGSVGDIAGICNPQGNVLGLMPHPENHIFPYQHPQWTRGKCGGSGLPLFRNGVRYAAESR